VIFGKGPFRVGDRIETLWMNYETEPIYLSSCSGYAFGSFTAPSVVESCPDESIAVKVRPGAWIRGRPFVVTDSMTLGINALFGHYHLGCQDGVPLSRATCRRDLIATGGYFFIER
jgi:hypothetical protein